MKGRKARICMPETYGSLKMVMFDEAFVIFLERMIELKTFKLN